MTKAIGVLFPSRTERMTKDELQVVAKALLAMQSDNEQHIAIPCPCCACDFNATEFAKHVANPPQWCLQNRWATIDDMGSPGELLDQWLTLGHQPRTVKTIDNLTVLYMQATLQSGRLLAHAVLADGEVVQLRAKQAAKILLHT